MIVLFPSHPLDPKKPDESFAPEVEAAKRAGFRAGLVDIEVMFGEVKIRLPHDRLERERALYRGWLLKPERYERVYNVLDGMHYPLVTTPKDYCASYMLPNWYRLLDPDAIGHRTPRSIVLPAESWGALPPDFTFDLGKLARHVHEAFGSSACIVKDYLKTQKHRWYDACFIPDASDEDHVKKVVATFLCLTGSDLVGGLVFREFESFEQMGIHPKSRTPMFNEWRAFMCKGKVKHLSPYWADGEYTNVERPSIALIESMAAPLARLPFIAVDFAKESVVPDAPPPEWRIVEVNDGGAAGVPREGDVDEFYYALRKAFPE